MTHPTKPSKNQSATDAASQKIASKLFGAASTNGTRKRSRHVPLRYEQHYGSEEALQWAAGDHLLPKSIRDWKEGALVVTDMVSQIMHQIRPLRLPALPSLGYNDPPGPVLKQFAEQLNLEGALEPDWKLIEVISGSDELIFCLVPGDMDVVDAEQRFEAYYESQESGADPHNTILAKCEREGSSENSQGSICHPSKALSMASTVYGLNNAPPSAADYLDALKEVWPKLTQHTADQIRAAFAAQIMYGGDITAVQMAIVLNLKGHLGANRLYGTFAHRIADALGVKGEPNQQWWPALSTSPGDDANGRFIWRLRPTLREALRRFGSTQDLFPE